MSIPEFAVKMVMEEYQGKPARIITKLYERFKAQRIEAENSKHVGSGGLLDARIKEEALRRLAKA